MGKIRLYELAKQLNIDSLVIMNILEDNNISVKNHMSVIDEDSALLVKNLDREAIDEYIEQSISGGVEDYDTINVENPDEDEMDEGEACDIVYPYAAIKIDRDQYSVFDIKRKYDQGRICIDPSFQRKFVWDNRQQSELIESVIMGIPLPLFYLAENKDGKLVVVDGRQRLTTFFRFLDGELKLNKLKILTDINGKKFKDLEKYNSSYSSMVEDYQLMIQVIKYPTPDRIRFDIFDRVNRGGTPLNKQEMRNALYQGKATELLDRITKDNSFIEATGSGISTKHMKDRYIALRAIAFRLIYQRELKDYKGAVISYRSDIDDILGNTMDYINQLSKEEVDKIQIEFITIMSNIARILGNNAFRIPGSDDRKRPISMTLFESLYYFFFLCLNVDVPDKTIKEKVDSLLSKVSFRNALQHAVDSSYSVESRFKMVFEAYKELEND